MKLLIFLIVITFPFFSGKPVKEARIILQDRTGRTQFAYQITGEKGKAAFQYLNAGSYRLVIEFPQQEGKWIKEKRRHQTLSKATYNKKNQTYYYQGREGFFSIKYQKVRKLDRETFRSVFKEIRGEFEGQIVINEFIAKRRGAQFSLQIKKLTAAQYKRFTDKAGGDISTISIPGMK